jgi:hypothetical protein
MVSPVNRGKVDWSGENPGIYLKDSDGVWRALAVFFKVVTSPLGTGAGVIVIGSPSSAAGFPQAPNLCLSNNEPLMRWLVERFVSQFASFRNAAGLSSMSFLPAKSLATDGDGRTFHQESIAGEGAEVVMRWEGLAQPFAVDVAPSMSATGKHQMYSVFVEAQRGTISLNGYALPGQVIQRDFLDRRMSTAFLAFSETWITPPD